MVNDKNPKMIVCPTCKKPIAPKEAEYDGEKCPVCKSTNMTLGELEFNGKNKIKVDITCADCSAMWIEVNEISKIKYTKLCADGDC